MEESEIFEERGNAEIPQTDEMKSYIIEGGESDDNGR